MAEVELPNLSSISQSSLPFLGLSFHLMVFFLSSGFPFSTKEDSKLCQDICTLVAIAIN